MLTALEEALAIDLEIEGAGSPDKMQFMEIARRDGLKAALAWRDARFPRHRRELATLPALLAGALRELRSPVESVDGDSRTAAADLLAIAERVAQATGRAPTSQPGEPVHRPHRQPAVRSRLAARRLAGRSGRGADPRQCRRPPPSAAVLKATGARFLIDVDRLEICGDAPRRTVRCCATPRWSSSRPAAPGFRRAW